MLKFSLCLLACAASFAVRATSITREIYLHCELFLDNGDASSAQTWINRRVRRVRPEAFAAIYDDGPSIEAFEALGLTAGEDYHLHLRADAIVENLNWLEVRSPHSATKFAIHAPPLWVWKRYDEENDHLLALDLEAEDARYFSTGVVVRDHADQRTFIALDESNPHFLTVSLGLDIDCRDRDQMTKSRQIHALMHSGRGDRCRVGVLKAYLPYKVSL